MNAPLDYTEEEETKAGAEIARILQLKPAKGEDRKRFIPDRYDTTHGNKTALGLYRTLAQFYISEK